MVPRNDIGTLVFLFVHTAFCLPRELPTLIIPYLSTLPTQLNNPQMNIIRVGSVEIYIIIRLGRKFSWKTEGSIAFLEWCHVVTVFHIIQRNLFQEKFKWPRLKIVRGLTSQIWQGVPGEHKIWENPGCCSPIQKWTLSNRYTYLNTNIWSWKIIHNIDCLLRDGKNIQIWLFLGIFFATFVI